MIFSNLGLLVLAEQMSKALNIPELACEADMESRLFAYESMAIHNVTAMVRCIFTPQNGDDSELSTHLGAGTSLMLDHINIGLVVQAIVKTIEHAIQLRSATTESFNDQDLENVLSPHQATWDNCIRRLTKCLLSLDSTLHASIQARAALKRLLGQHGDSIMKCWSPEHDQDTQPLFTACAPMLVVDFSQ